ncbi:LytR family transcriptional regulator [Loigolactobacillus backii]|uniref:LCP family protein n=1 Tax=Loigolactobacillus backii TaxID=375175 RepID=UPI000C1C96AA|nr:LCP family protein [Loigolactobacillus backii]PIO83106.1 LytR family transcriptional regulator [Loigolactobacillus backii]
MEETDTPSRMAQRPPKKGHPFIKILLLIISIILILSGIFIVKFYHDTGKTIKGMYAKDGIPTTTTIQQHKPISILLLGADTGAAGRTYRGNSDTIILATINPDTKKMTLNSIPRDTLAELSGSQNSTMQKINAAYDLGGSKMAVNSVQHLLNVPVSYYMTINMGALQTLVDDVGGIDVNIPFSFTSVWTGGQKFKKGMHHLNGEQALAYTRMRHEDPRGDYGRQIRQQQVIRAILKKAATPKMLFDYDKVLKDLENNVRTNLTFAQIKTLALHYHGATADIKSDQLQGQDAWITGSSYQVASTKELNRLSKKIRKELGLSATTLSNAETYQNSMNPTFDGVSNQYFYIYGNYNHTAETQTTEK